METPTFEQWCEELRACADAEGLHVRLDARQLLDEFDIGTTIRQLLDRHTATSEAPD